MTRSRFAAVMSQPSPVAPHIVVKNRYPDYLTVTLAAVPLVDTTFSQSSADANSLPPLDLQLTLKFGHHWEVQAEHRAQFGLTGGVLTLGIEQGRLQPSLAVAAAPEMPIRVRRVTEGPQTYEWQLVSTADLTALDGTIAALSLGQLHPDSTDCRVLIAFTVAAPDIHLTAAEGLWRHDISPNKHAILERKLVWTLVEPRFHPYLSWAQISYTADRSPVTALVPTPIEVSLQTIQPVIDQIMAAASDRLPDLAALAELDLLRDFAGGNLRGTNLNGLDLSGAKLDRANLRGADLSDADLSDASLRDAKLSGADLSGAYLSNADLRHSDFYRASLALATLSGADLEGANLREANLSSTHLGHAQVKHARFGQNPGLTGESEQSLRSRGAIFPDA